jgi:hypothetical protein
MRFIKSILVVAVSFLTFASVAVGQQGQRKAPMMKQQTINPDSISDDELRQVAMGMQKAQQIRMQAQADVKKIVEDGGLSYKRFQQIMMSKRSKKMKQKINVTDEEKAKMDTLRPKIQSAQKSARKEMMQAIQSTGMSTKKFQQIVSALRQNKKLQKRYKRISKKVRRDNKKKMKKKMKDMKKNSDKQ